MSRRVQENIIAVLLLALFTAVLIISFEYGPRARLVPVPISVLCVALTIVQLVWQNLRSADELHVNVLEFVGQRPKAPAQPAAADGTAAPEDARPDRKNSLGRQATALGMVIALVGLFLLLGPVPATFLFSAGYFIISGHCSWGRGVLYAAVLTTVIFVMFGQVLDIQLNRGAVAPFITDYVDF